MIAKEAEIPSAKLESALGQAPIESSRPIRILTLCQVQGGGGGADRIVLQTAAQVSPDDAEFLVCCLRDPRDTAFDFHVRALSHGVNYIEIADRYKYDPSVLKLLRRLVKEYRIQIIDAHGYKSVLYAHQLAKKEGVVPVATLHGWTGHTWRERFLYYPLEKLLVRSFPAAIGVSSEIRNTLLRWGAKPPAVHTLLNGCDVTQSALSKEQVESLRRSIDARPTDFVVGAAGRLEPQKRFDLLLKAAQQLTDKYPSMRFVIAGDGGLRQSIERQIQQLGLERVCRLLGHRNDMSQLYRVFDVLVQSSDYEGTPTVIVEAMCASVPIVATRVGGTEELIEDRTHALLVPPRNVNAIASAIENVFTSPGDAQRRANIALHRVKSELSFARRTERLLAIYRGVLHSKTELA